MKTVLQSIAGQFATEHLKRLSVEQLTQSTTAYDLTCEAVPIANRLESCSMFIILFNNAAPQM